MATNRHIFQTKKKQKESFMCSKGPLRSFRVHFKKVKKSKNDLKQELKTKKNTRTHWRETEGDREDGGRASPEAPWVGAWPRPRRNRWRTVQRSGEAEEAASEVGPSGGSPECSYGSAHQPVVAEHSINVSGQEL